MTDSSPHRALLLLTLLACLSLAGCDTAREQLGLGKQQPDAFTVYSRAPLSMPPAPYFELPKPGSAKPAEDAKTIIPGLTPPQAESGVEVGAAEQALKAKAKTAQAQPDIRAVLDQEAGERKDDSSWWDLRDYLNSKENTDLLDPAAEKERLKNNTTPKEPPRQAVPATPPQEGNK
jgi:hypothetical protein